MPTYYLSQLLKDLGDEGGFRKAQELKDAGNTIIIDAESILKRTADSSSEISRLEKAGYKFQVNSDTLKREFPDNYDAALGSLMKKGWKVYSQPTPQQAQQQQASIAQAATPMEPAHVPEPEIHAALGQMMESPHVRPMPPSVTGQGMRAATPEEAQLAKQPAPPTERWIQGQNMLQPTESAPQRVQPEQGIPGRAAQRVLDVAMAPMGAGLRSVLMPERYWTAVKSLANVLANSTYQALDAVGIGKHQYTDWFNSQSKSFDQDLGKVLGPVEDVTTVLWRNPIVALGLLGATTRTIADMIVTPFSSEEKGRQISGAQMREAPLTAAVVDPVGSAFESVGDLAAKSYEMAGGSPETANGLRGLGTVAVLMAFNAASAQRVRAISEKVKKGEKLAPEEQQVVDQVAPNQPAENVAKILDNTAKTAEVNAEVLGKAKENQVVQTAIQKTQEVPRGEEVQGQEAVTSESITDKATNAEQRINRQRQEAIQYLSSLANHPKYVDKAIRGEELTPKETESLNRMIGRRMDKLNADAICGNRTEQGYMAAGLFDENRPDFAIEEIRSGREDWFDPENPQPIPAADLNKGEQFSFKGEQFKVVDKSGESVTIQDGATVKLGKNDVVYADPFSFKNQEVPNAEGIRENAGRLPEAGNVAQGGEVQGGANLEQQAQVQPGNAPEAQVKQPWEMTRDEFSRNTKNQREGYSEGILSLKGWGDPGVTVENRNIKVGNKIDEGVDITYRNKEGLPVAIARLTKDTNGNLAVDDFGVRKNIGLLRGRAVVEIGKEIEKLGADKPLDSISSDASRLYHHRIVQKAISEGKPVPPEVLAEYPDLVKSVTHQMPSGETMAGPEHPGAVPGSTVVSPQEVAPPTEMAASTPAGAIIQGIKRAMSPKPRPDLAEEPRSLFEDPEQYFRENRGLKIQEPTLWEKVKGPIQRVAQSFKRSRVNINPQASIPEAVTQESLRRFQDARDRSQMSAVETIADFTKDLGPNRKNLLYRVIMLEDLKKDLESQKIDINERPLGYDSVENVEADLQNLRSQMLSDPKTADAYGRRQALLRPIIQRLVDAGRLPEEALEDPRYYHHQVLEHYTEGGRPLGSLDLRLHKKGFEMRRMGSSSAINTEGIESDFEWLSQAHYQLNTLEAQDAIRQAADIKQRLKNERDVIREATGTDAEIQIPEGYVEWQVPSNHPFYQANTLPARVMSEIMQEGQATIEAGDVGKALAVGKAQTWIIPENIAKELDNLTRLAPKTVPGELARGINNAWKRWVILNPWRASKYMLNNLTGDLDATIAIAPGTLKYAPKIARQLWNKMWKGEATPEFQKMFDDAMSKSVLQSGLTLEEIPDVKKLPALRLLEATMDKQSPFWKRPDKMVGDAVAKYWGNVNTLNVWRESVLRMSAYEYWKDKLKSGDRRYYGASDRATMDQMYEAVKEGKITLDDVAARLARDTLGDYGNISQAGQWMRRTTHPFWSWVEVNVPRYYNLFKNIGAESSGKDLAGAATYLGARFAGKAAYNAAKVYAFSQAFYALVNLYNKSVYPQEDKLINKDKDQLYLITPFKNDDGSRRVVRFSGALSDALDMFGARNYIQDVQDLASGARGAKDVAWQYLSAVPENLWQRLGPAYKGLVEIGTQRQTYPRFLTERWPQGSEIKDFLTTGRPVRSGWQQMWKYAALDWVYNTYRRSTGQPMPGRDTAVADLISTSIDTNQAAYYAIRSKTFDYLREHKMEEPPPGAYKDKANAAYFFKVASQIDDKDAAKYWFGQYMNYAKEDWARNMARGKTDKDFIDWALSSLNKSVEASSPLGAIPESDRAAFISTLNPDEKEMLNAAMRWYHRKLPRKSN